MAFLENGSPVATKLGPIATLNTALGNKAAATSIFEIPSTTRRWLAMPQTTSGTYSFVTSTGTATLYVYDTNNDLAQEISVTTTASSVAIAVNFNRIECVASGALDLSVTPANAKITSAGGTLSLDTLTTTGNYGAGSGTSGSYTSGQYAHVIVVGGCGGGGGGVHVNSPQGSYGTTGGGGGTGGVSATTSAFELTGTYSITVGAGGNGGNSPSGGSGGNGNAGGTSNAFSLTSNGGNGGNGAPSYQSHGTSGTDGTPAMPANTDIYLTTSTTDLNISAGGSGSPFSPGGNGSAGKVLVLRWTP